MRLQTRLLLGFLGALAAVLAGFSAMLHLLASTYLHRRADERLESVVNTLVAAAEVNDSGVEWEPEERLLAFVPGTTEGRFFWRVRDPRGGRLDGSSREELRAMPTPSIPDELPRARPITVRDRDGRPWRVLTRRLERPGARVPGRRGASAAPGHESIVIEAGVSLSGVRAELFNLGLASVGLSGGIWLVALGFARRLCRRALRPVSAMAEAVHRIGDAPDGRLPVPETGDELEGLCRSFNALLDRLQESFERQRRFTGDASHQLRTPLTAIQGQVDLTLRLDRDPGEYRRVLGLVQRRTRHLRQIVEALLFLARADAEVLRPELITIDLSRWLEGHLRARIDPIRGSDLRREAAPEDSSTIRAQPALLGELLENLLDNASKYSRPGTPITIRAGRGPRGVTLSVEDRGTGIAEEDRRHLFEPFYRAEEARRRGAAGLGLGLSVASRLAALFGATIEVESRPGFGSTFSVHFPEAERRSAPAGAGASAPSGQ